METSRPPQGGGTLARLYGGRRWMRMVALVAITGGVLAVLLARFDARAVWSAIRGADPALLAAAVAATLTLPLVSSVRWNAALRAAGERVPYGRCLRGFLAALPLNMITPSKAGDVLRAFFLADLVDPWKGTGIVVVERIVDTGVLASLALAGAIATGAYRAAAVAAAVLGAAIAVVVAAPLAARIPLGEKARARIAQVTEGARSLRARPAWLLCVVAASALVWTTCMTVAFLLFRSLGAGVGPIGVAASVPLAIFAGLAPVTIGGMGTRDAALVLLMAGAATEATSLAVGLLYSVIAYWMPSILGLPFLAAALRRGLPDRPPGPPRG